MEDHDHTSICLLCVSVYWLPWILTSFSLSRCPGAYVLVRDALSVSQDGDSQHWALAIALPLLLPLHHQGELPCRAEIKMHKLIDYLTRLRTS